MTVGLFLAGCSVPVSTQSPEDIFTAVNDSMLQGDINTALTYACEGTEPTEEQLSMIRMALNLVPEEMRSSIEYTVDETTEMDGYTEIKATMSLLGQSQKQTAKIYHEASEGSADYCVNLTETMQQENSPLDEAEDVLAEEEMTPAEDMVDAQEIPEEAETPTASELEEVEDAEEDMAEETPEDVVEEETK